MKHWNPANSGARAGCEITSGYRHISIDGITYKEHRVIWTMITGEEPPPVIDHEKTQSN
jgi:hypothetical protein